MTRPTHSAPLWRTALATAALAALAGCSGSEPKASAETTSTPRIAYVAEVRNGPPNALAFVGEVRAAQRAELAFAVGGRVATVHVNPGDVVRSGQALAELDAQPLRAQLAMATGEVAKAQAQLNEIRQRLARVQVAAAAGAVGGSELGQVQAEAGTAEAALLAAQGQREAASWSLQHAVLRAPVDGVVGVRAIEPGQAAGPGAPVITLDGHGRELSVVVPEGLHLKAGQAISLLSGGQVLSSRVLRVGGRLEAGGLQRVHIAVPATAPVGSTWTVTIDQPASDAPATVQVPLRAVMPDAQTGRGHVLRLAGDGRTTEKVAVTLGAVQGEWVGITQGLSAGQRVVIAGAVAIAPGTVVKPVTYGREVRS